MLKNGDPATGPPTTPAKFYSSSKPPKGGRTIYVIFPKFRVVPVRSLAFFKRTEVGVPFWANSRSRRALLHTLQEPGKEA